MEDTLITGTEPNLKELMDEFTRAGAYGIGPGRNELNEQRRLMLWDGQSDDGKKWDENMPSGKLARPWQGASDTRVPLIDEVCNELVAMETAAYARAQVRVQGVEWSDAGIASQSRTFLNWLVRGKLRKVLSKEVELLAQYGRECGWAMLYVGWEREISTQRRTVTQQELLTLAQNQPPQSPLAQLPGLIADPVLEENAANVVQQIYDIYIAQQTAGLHEVELPQMSFAKARRVVRELRTKGEAEVPFPIIARNGPCAVALKPYDDVLLSPGTIEAEGARAIFRRFYLSEAKLRARAQAENWDEAFVEEAVQKKGVLSTWWRPNESMIALKRDATGIGSVDMKEDVIEIVYGYVRKVDNDGVPCIWCTVFCPALGSQLGASRGDGFGKHELVDYAHGCYPFISYAMEQRTRTLMDSRSVPEIAFTWQNEEKEQRDMLFNRSQWDTLPPIIVPKLMGVDYRFGPATQIPSVRAGGIAFMDGPNRPPTTALQLISLIEQRTSNYFGRASQDVPPYRAQLLQEKAVSDFLGVWAQAWVMMLALQVQYDPGKIQQVTNRPWPMEMTPERILDQIDLILVFDVKELDPDYLLKKMDIVSKAILPEDVTGVIDRTKMIKWKMQMLDPQLAEELIMDQAGASQQMFRQVNNDVALIALGNEAEYVENDPTAATKLKFLQDIVGRNPRYQQGLKQDERFRELLTNYEANLQQSVEQEENKKRGRIGVKPMTQTQGGV